MPRNFIWASWHRMDLLNTDNTLTQAGKTLIREKYNKELEKSNYQNNDSLVKIFEQIEQVRKDLNSLNELHLQRDMYRREIRQLKYSDF